MRRRGRTPYHNDLSGFVPRDAYQGLVLGGGMLLITLVLIAIWKFLT